jgi:uncharacterized protein YeeX (DUF496 family)
MSCGFQQTVSVAASAPAYSVAPAQNYVSAAPAYSIAQAAPAYSVAQAAPAYSVVQAAPVAAAPCAQLNRWADYSPQPQELGLPALPPVDSRCYQPPQVPPGQNQFRNVQEQTAVRNLQQNFNDVRTAVRENNIHVQRNKTNITNVNRNHNHLLKIVTNENNYEHNLQNNVVRVADIHRQRIENVPGQRRQFKDFKATQKVENLGCRRDATIGAVAVAAPAPAPCAPCGQAAQAFTAAAAPVYPVARAVEGVTYL